MHKKQILFLLISSLLIVFTSFAAAEQLEVNFKHQITYTPMTVNAGDVVTFTATIKAHYNNVTNVKIQGGIDGVPIWTETYPSMMEQEQKVVTFTWTAAPGSHTAFFKLDPDNTINEVYENNNLSEIQIEVVQVQTLNLMFNGSIFITNPSFHGGDTLNIRAQVYNQFDAVDNVKVTTSVNGTQVCEQIIPHLDHLEYKYVYCDWVSTSGSHQMTFTLDPNNTYAETNENDNVMTAIRNVSAPPVDPSVNKDLKFNGNLSLIPLSPKHGETQTISAYFYGTAVTMQNVKVVGGIDGIVKWTQIYPTVVPGEAYKQPSFTWVATEGNHTAFITLDPDNTIAELDETDNTRTHPIIVTAAAPPAPRPFQPCDPFWNSFEGIKMNINPPALKEGDKTKIWAKLELTGETAVNLKVIAGVDKQTIYTKTFPSFQAIQKSVISFDWIAKRGDHIIWFKIDPENKQNDTNRSNNQLKETINVKFIVAPPSGIKIN
ncbi:MAG: hypothetical protein JW737_01470 [Acidobacteria bacterium]|nr:hypothetical protein [Acidobacteriota bacterium]